jgi:hypothetical protein
VVPWKTPGKDVKFIIQALFGKVPAKSTFSAKNFQRDYLKILNHREFQWNTVLSLEREVTNAFYEKEIIEYDFLAQREIKSLSSPGTTTYLTERKAVQKST